MAPRALPQRAITVITAGALCVCVCVRACARVCVTATFPTSHRYFRRFLSGPQARPYGRPLSAWIDSTHLPTRPLARTRRRRAHPLGRAHTRAPERFMHASSHQRMHTRARTHRRWRAHSARTQPSGVAIPARYSKAQAAQVLQHTATCCNMPQHVATYRSMLQRCAA